MMNSWRGFYNMKVESFILVGLIVALILTAISYLLFSFICVRRLRKNPNTKALLGLEFMSGWDVINIAQALTFPHSWSEKLAQSPLSSIYANAQVINEHVNYLDKVLGRIFYTLLILTGFGSIFYAIAFGVGVFE